MQNAEKSLTRKRRLSSISNVFAELDSNGVNTNIHGVLFFNRDILRSEIVQLGRKLLSLPRFGDLYDPVSRTFHGKASNLDVGKLIHDVPRERWRRHSDREPEIRKDDPVSAGTPASLENEVDILEEVSDYLSSIYDKPLRTPGILWDIHILRMGPDASDFTQLKAMAESTDATVKQVTKVFEEASTRSSCVLVIRISHIIGDGGAILMSLQEVFAQGAVGSAFQTFDAPARRAGERDITQVRKQDEAAQCGATSWIVRSLQWYASCVTYVLLALYHFFLYRAPRVSLYSDARPPSDDVTRKGNLGGETRAGDKPTNVVKRKIHMLRAIDLEEVKSVGRALGNHCTVHDILTTCIHGALRMCLEESQTKGPDDVAVLNGEKTLYSIVPVNMQPVSSNVFGSYNEEVIKKRLGNHSSTLIIPIQLQKEASVVNLLQRVSCLMSDFKASPQKFVYHYGGILGQYLAPVSLAAFCSRSLFENCPLIITNVPGPTTPCALPASAVIRGYGVACAGSAPVNAVVVSYCGKIYITLCLNGFTDDSSIHQLPSHILNMWSQLRSAVAKSTAHESKITS